MKRQNKKADDEAITPLNYVCSELLAFVLLLFSATGIALTKYSLSFNVLLSFHMCRVWLKAILWHSISIINKEAFALHSLACRGNTLWIKWNSETLGAGLRRMSPWLWMVTFNQSSLFWKQILISFKVKFPADWIFRC